MKGVEIVVRLEFGREVHSGGLGNGTGAYRGAGRV